MKQTTTIYLQAIALHVFLGLFVYLFKPFGKFYFFAALIIFFYRIVTTTEDKRVYEVLKACAYFVGAELFFRMTKASISYEVGKYLVIVFSLMGMFYKGVSGRGYPYFFYLMFLIPSIFVASTTLSFDANFRTNIAFVLSGPVCLGIASLFTYERKVTITQLINTLWYMALPIITLTTYLYLYSPTLEDELSNNVSNLEASGGFGPNQVATILGLGIFIIGSRFLIASPNFVLKLVHIALFMAMSHRALITFSRGGVIVAVISLMAFIIIYYINVNYKRKSEFVLLTLLILGGSVASWTISTIQTKGFLELRYANKDTMGREKEDATTGRKDLFINEIEGFKSNPFFGIGSSRAKDQRIEEEGQGLISHNEISRLLSEHGIFGIIILSILLFRPLVIRSEHKKNVFFYAFLCFWFATINHSAMRLAAPGFVYALALLRITYDNKRPVHRQLPPSPQGQSVGHVATGAAAGS